MRARDGAREGGRGMSTLPSSGVGEWKMRLGTGTVPYLDTYLAAPFVYSWQALKYRDQLTETELGTNG